MTTFFPTWRADGPPPLPPLFGLVPAGDADAAGVRILVDVDGREMEEKAARDLPDFGSDSALAQPGMERWLNGIALWPYPAGVPELFDQCAHGSRADTKGFGASTDVPEFAAFTIDVPETCTAQQIPDQAEFRARAQRVIAAVESYGVEKALLTGEPFDSGQPYLADGDGVFPNGNSPVRPNYGIQLLEEQIAESGRLGIIHCSPMLATALMGSGFALSDKTGVIRTINGIPVIPGFGYASGAAPFGHPDAGATEEWAYATGPVDIRRSNVFTTPDELSQALDRGIPGQSATNGRPNTITYRSERYYTVVWDKVVQAAVLIDRCSDDCNPAS